MNTTVRMKASQIYKDWHVIDAAGRPLGRVATEAAILLRGKHKPTYEPHLDDGDFVIIINAAQVRVTGRKSEQIKYRTHSGFPGGLKTRTYEQQMAKFPERVLEQAVWGMLPGGPLGEAIFKHLKVYKTAQHPHQSQITGSERARDARAAAFAEASIEPMKARRLRKLSVPDSVAQASRDAEGESAAPSSASAAASRARAKVGRAPRDAGASTTAAEQEAQDEAVLSSDSPAIADPVTPSPAEAAIAAAPATEEAAVESEAAPKPRARRKAASDDAVAEGSDSTEPEAMAEDESETPKPARRRSAKTEE